MIFNNRIRTEQGSTSIGAVITGAVASIGLVATGVAVSSSIIPEDIDTSSSSGVCVKAYYSTDESIQKTDCVYLNSQAGVNAPGGNNPTPEEGEEEESPATFSCIPELREYLAASNKANTDYLVDNPEYLRLSAAPYDKLTAEEINAKQAHDNNRTILFNDANAVLDKARANGVWSTLESQFGHISSNRMSENDEKYMAYATLVADYKEQGMTVDSEGNFTDEAKVMSLQKQIKDQREEILEYVCSG